MWSRMDAWSRTLSTEQLIALGVICTLITFPIRNFVVFLVDLTRRCYILRSIPSVKYGFFGTVEDLASPQQHRVSTQLANELGPVFKSRILWFHFVTIADPHIISEVIHDSQSFDKIHKMLFPLNEMTSANYKIPSMVTAPSDATWKAVRKAVAYAFNPQNMRRGFKDIARVGEQLVSALRVRDPAEAVDVDDWLQRQSIDVIGAFGFGRDLGAMASLKGSGTGVDRQIVVTDALAEAQLRFSEPYRKFKTWREDVRRGAENLRKFHTLTQEVLQYARTRHMDADTIAGRLLQVKDPKTGKPLSEQRMAAEIGIIFVAGFETTGHTMGWVLYLVSQHPEVEAKIVAELQQQGLCATRERPRPRLPAFEDMRKLAYLTRVIKETLRMYPVAGTATTRVNEDRDTLLGGGRWRVPAGVPMRLHIHATQNCAANWERPAEFLPERWLEPNAEYARGANADAAASPAGSKQHQESTTPAAASRDADANDADEDDHSISKLAKRFFPFSDGPRNCVGYPLAMLNMTSTLAQLYGNFTFKLADQMGGPEGVKAKEQTVITLRPAGGMLMHCLPRLPAT